MGQQKQNNNALFFFSTFYSFYVSLVNHHGIRGDMGVRFKSHWLNSKGVSSE